MRLPPAVEPSCDGILNAIKSMDDRGNKARPSYAPGMRDGLGKEPGNVTRNMRKSLGKKVTYRGPETRESPGYTWEESSQNRPSKNSREDSSYRMLGKRIPEMHETMLHLAPQPGLTQVVHRGIRLTELVTQLTQAGLIIKVISRRLGCLKLVVHGG